VPTSLLIPIPPRPLRRLFPPSLALAILPRAFAVVAVATTLEFRALMRRIRRV
jgi:hypothetical protein